MTSGLLPVLAFALVLCVTAAEARSRRICVPALIEGAGAILICAARSPRR